MDDLLGNRMDIYEEIGGLEEYDRGKEDLEGLGR